MEAEPYEGGVEFSNALERLVFREIFSVCIDNLDIVTILAQDRSQIKEIQGGVFAKLVVYCRKVLIEQLVVVRGVDECDSHTRIYTHHSRYSIEDPFYALSSGAGSTRNPQSTMHKKVPQWNPGNGEWRYEY